LHKHLGILFLYQDIVPPTKQPVDSPERKPGALDDAGLPGWHRDLPPEWIDRLRRAASLGSIDSVSAAIEQIGTRHPALAEELTALADEFAYDEILTLIRDSGHADAGMNAA
jgi:hypothetical protein